MRWRRVPNNQRLERDRLATGSSGTPRAPGRWPSLHRTASRSPCALCLNFRRTIAWADQQTRRDPAFFATAGRQRAVKSRWRGQSANAKSGTGRDG